MQKGDLVIVHAYPDEFLERIVWEEFPQLCGSLQARSL